MGDGGQRGESANVAMVTKTLVANGAAVAAGAAPLTLASFLDLSSLLDAVVVLDGLEAIESSDVLPAYPLTATLGRERLLEPFVPRLDRRELRRVLLRLPEPLAHLVVPHVNDLEANQEDRRAEPALTPFGALSGVDYDRSPEDLFAQFDEVITYPSLDPAERNVAEARAQRLLRSNWYLIMATANGLDYFPDFDRVPFVSSVIQQMYRSLPAELYARVADALGASDAGRGTLVSEWTLDAKLPIPPVTALVLERSRTLDELPERLLEVRDEFAGYRRHFRAFKQELQSADTLAERRALERRYQALLQEASGPDNEVASASEVLNFAERAVAAAAAPALATSYSASLIAQPLEWLRRWWLRRPLAVLYRLDGKLPRLSEYRGLIERLWGTQVHDDLLDEYSRHAGQVSRLIDAPRRG
jgi:hypothetical protein